MKYLSIGILVVIIVQVLGQSELLKDYLRQKEFDYDGYRKVLAENLSIGNCDLNKYRNLLKILINKGE